MKKLLLLCILSFMPLLTMAAGGSKVPLESIQTNPADKLSLQRGMQLFVNYCLGCHSAGYQRYERAANDLEIPHDLVMENLVFTDQKIGEHMISSMDPEQARVWFGAPPPDLTNEVNLRGADWLYTYLKTFYVDEDRPYGVNNFVFPNVGMPNVLAELQGIQTLSCDSDGTTCEWAIEEGTGSMTPIEFDEAIYDLTNFMAYMSKPNLQTSHSLGIKVILFLIFMTTVFYFLYKEMWRDIDHGPKH